jgi:cell division protein FtsL
VGLKAKSSRKRSAPAAPASVRLALFSAAAALLVLVSAFSVIGSTHHSRQLYAQLQVLEASRWHLQEDYSRLLLEQSTWASHYRVEKVATRELGMHPPEIGQLKVVRP